MTQNTFLRKRNKVKQQSSTKPSHNSLQDLSLTNVSAADLSTQEISFIKAGVDQFYVEQQVRRRFDDHEIEERAASLQQNGQFQAITVHPKDDRGYKIDKGECRWRAAKLLEQRGIKFELIAWVDQQANNRSITQTVVGQLGENDQRSDLTSFEMAKAIEKLQQQSMSNEQIAVALGWVSKETQKPNSNKVSRYLSILKMPQQGQQLAEKQIINDVITLETLRKINDKSPQEFQRLCSLAEQNVGLSRKEVELQYQRCRQLNKQQPKSEASNKPRKLKQILVSYQGREAELQLSIATDNPQKIWIKHQQGEPCLVSVEDLQILSMQFS